MTIAQDKMLKILVSVDEDQVGGKFVTKTNYPIFEDLVNALKFGNPITIIKVDSGNPVYKIGTAFDEETQTFSATEADIQMIHTDPFSEVFIFVSDSKIVYIDILETAKFDGMIAAYQSSPTFSIEEVPYGQFR